MARTFTRIPTPARPLVHPKGKRAACPCGRVVRVRGKQNLYTLHKEWQNGSGAIVKWCKWSNTPARAERTYNED